MDDGIDSLVVEVRAGTEGFDRDVQQMRTSIDGKLVPGFDRASDVLARGLSGAIRNGSASFDDLKRVAFDTLDAIAAQSLKSLLGTGSIGGSAPSLDLGSVIGAALGLPGRATGGNVAPGQAYLVGERGPEVFVPTSAGRVQAGSSPGREVRVSIQLNTPAGASTPRSLQRSSRQVASAVRRALASN